MGILYHPIVFLCLGICAGLVAGIFLRKRFIEGHQNNIRAQSKQIIENAIVEAEQLKKEALLQSKEEAYRVKQALEQELKAERDELKDEMRQLNKKREALKQEWDGYDVKNAELVAGEKKLRQREVEIESKLKDVDQLVDKQRYEMARIAGISQEEAKKMLMDSLESEARMDAAKRLVKIENEMKMEADRKGKNILALAISRYAGDYVADKTVSMVPLPNDEMKGRIIGREGRNIRAIEAATGIDIIIDDTPEAVILSGFNPVRREIARLALLQLISDGRIHPGRIEEVVAKINGLQDEVQGLRQQVSRVRQEWVKTEFEQKLENIPLVAGVPVLSGLLKGADIDSLRLMTDIFRQKHPAGVVAIGSVINDKPMLIVAVTEDLVKRGLYAGEFVRQAAALVGGSGGGRPVLAQAGGKDAEKLPDALASIAELVRQKLA